MKKILFGIFAHPDDEAFGPAATLVQEAAAGTGVHLICVTSGQVGENLDAHNNLGAVRKAEWLAAGKLIGAAGMHLLPYGDGDLSNNLYHAIAKDVEATIRANVSPGDEVSLMTFAPNGMTGHLDHIAVSYITTYVFYHLKQSPPPSATVKELAYFCLSRQQMPAGDMNYFVYMPEGYDDSYINRQVDVRALIPKKREIIAQHYSQRADAEAAWARGEDFHATDNFHVII